MRWARRLKKLEERVRQAALRSRASLVLSQEERLLRLSALFGAALQPDADQRTVQAATRCGRIILAAKARLEGQRELDER